MAAVVFILVSVLTAAYGQMSGNGTTHERGEYEGFLFIYDGNTGLLLVTMNQNCYIWELTPEEKQNIHTDEGLRNAELRALQEIDGSYYTKIPKVVINPSIWHSCPPTVHGYFLVH